jgi:signal transduction histidine kinase
VAYFPYLPPGNYTFRVIAANSDGVWNNEGAMLEIFVATPFYRAWWFMALVTLSLAGMALFVYQRRFAAMRARQAEQEAFSRQLIESQEAERKRIAAELHDSLGQNLLIVKNWALVGLNTLGSENPAREHLSEISETTSLALDEVREIAHNLRPYQLERLGLTNTLEFMMRQVRNSCDLEFTVELENVDGLLAPESEINLYRIVQELINNVIKHSDATEAWLSVKRTDYGAQIICRDNGKGFDPATAAKSRNSGMGLSGLAERVRLLGGHHTIESAPGKGTMVSVAVESLRQ